MGRNEWENLSDKLTALHKEMEYLQTELDGLKITLEQAAIDSETDYIQSRLEKSKYIVYKQKEDWLEIAEEAADNMAEACDCVEDVISDLKLIQI